jgi:hypothetical protein
VKKIIRRKGIEISEMMLKVKTGSKNMYIKIVAGIIQER